MSHLTVWRDKQGPSVATYSRLGERVPLVLVGDSIEFADADTVAELVAAREPFSPVHITRETAKSVLGWDDAREEA